MLKKIICSLLLFVLLPLSAQAMPCHCFSARDFDPREPAAADPYYLATSQNSFFSIVFNIAKKQVVFAKQKPSATAEGLWVVNWLSLATGKDINSLKKGKKSAGSWLEGLKTVGAALDSLPARFVALLNTGAPEDTLSRYVVDELLKAAAGIEEKDLQLLRAANASNEETILATFLGRKTTQPPAAILQSVSSGETTWGTLMLKSGMKGRDMVEEIRTLLKAEHMAETTASKEQLP